MVVLRLRMIIAFVVFAFILPVSVTAEEEEEEDPLQLSLINVSKKGGKKGYKTVHSYLKKNDNIKLLSQKKVIKIAKKLGVKKDNLRSGKWRKKNAKKLSRLISKSKLESLMLLDIYAKGKKSQLVTIGPDGKQVSSIVKKIKRGRITRGKAKEMLKKSFKKVVPIVRAVRGGDEDEDEDDDEDEDESSDEDSKEEKEKETSNEDNIADSTAVGAYPELETGFTVNLGMILGKREITLNSTTGQAFVLKHENPYLGFGGQIDGVFMNMGTMGIGVSLFGGYAPFTTIFQNKKEFASRFSQLGADLKLLLGFSSKLTLNILGGAETTSITIDDNPFYTGTRYISARAGLGFIYLMGDVRLEANFVVLPIFDTDTANGAYGEYQGLGIGFAPHITAQFNLTDSLFAGLRYDLRLLPAKYSKAPVLTDNANVESSDIIHSGFISIGYDL